jgi:hypothetical protein
VKITSSFYQSLFSLPSKVEQDDLTVLDAGLPQFDFNSSNHLPAGAVIICFLTNDLPEMQKRLSKAGVNYEAPVPSHLGTQTISKTQTATL